MLLRSSSTPVLGSLLSSFSESPIHHSDPHTTTTKSPSATNHHNHNHIHNKLSFHQNGSLNFTTYSCNTSPISPVIPELSEPNLHSRNGFPRAQSEGNLEGLVNASCNHDESHSTNPHKKFSRRAVLQTIPSFSFHNSESRYEDEDSDEEEELKELEGNCELFENSNTGEESIMAMKNGESHLSEKKIVMNREMALMNKYSHGFEADIDGINTEMYLATGLGVNVANSGFGGSGGGDFIPVAFGRDGGDGTGLEQHYKRMVEENPGNSLCLRNYGHFLYQLKRDLRRAEEYYSRAILADPIDGDVLSQYAKLVWELHHDQDRATSYFERAVQAAPEDSHVQAAYANFLWETEEDGDEDGSQNDRRHVISQPFHVEAMASQTG
ncbi:uncharacterized protein LOC132269087 [Cornus florida]|uniref:uncharacterized protein LOC132269087 n=1 Tax=Cornus florida TaxID=4283 RepID=UPI00289AAD91|nr:uncharacterized protein LOC132269087 [Cornus florida]XP_059626097.1 uncharacterized protein LOC132269087 [Cornus florida]